MITELRAVVRGDWERVPEVLMMSLKRVRIVCKVLATPIEPLTDRQFIFSKNELQILKMKKTLDESLRTHRWYYSAEWYLFHQKKYAFTCTETLGIAEKGDSFPIFRLQVVTQNLHPQKIIITNRNNFSEKLPLGLGQLGHVHGHFYSSHLIWSLF